jgi:HAD superfamily hydrolase (TIGR01509 family)
VTKAAIVDVDGTLVDSNYHHTLAWYRAFREHDVTIPVWKLHRHVGMGGDKYVPAVAGDEVEEELGDELRERWEQIFDGMTSELAPLPGARALLVALKAQGLAVVLASSSIQKHLDISLDLLDARDVVDGWTTKDDVDASKPEPDLVRAALDKAGTDDALMIGDSPWDVEAARKAGIPTVCVLTGGFGRDELEGAGAAAVYESPAELARTLERALSRVS